MDKSINKSDNKTRTIAATGTVSAFLLTPPQTRPLQLLVERTKQSPSFSNIIQAGAFPCWYLSLRNEWSSTAVFSNGNNDDMNNLQQKQQQDGPTSISTTMSTPTTLNDNNDNENENKGEKEQVDDDAMIWARTRLQPHFPGFSLDHWQIEAGREILRGHNVIVCAATGAGKTVVGEMALHVACERDRNAIYTTPLKALSNQKFAELRQVFQPTHNVGLSTGDMSINHGARITVMTTEVYRNMAWRANNKNDNDVDRMRLELNDVVVLDEFHYMGEPGRGGVWEECVITSPSHTQIVGLSATLPNAARLAAWMEDVTGRKTTLVEAKGSRPVPLRYMFATRDGLYSMFKDADAGPGAPNGLLGLRGDGKASQLDERKRKKAGLRVNELPFRRNKIPSGLKINPALRVSQQKRLQRIDKEIQKKMDRDASGGADRNDARYDSRFDRGSGGGRKSKERARNRQRLQFESQGRTPMSQNQEQRQQSVRRTMSRKQEQRERDRLVKVEMRKDVPSLEFLLRRMKKMDLLPAIVFIFSRAGCDNAARSVCNAMRESLKERKFPSVEKQNDEGTRKRKTRQRGKRANSESKEENDDPSGSMISDTEGRVFRKGSITSEDSFSSIMDGPSSIASLSDSNIRSELLTSYAQTGLLNLDQVREVMARVSAFNEENEEIALDEATIDCLLYGIGSHHAGMLPAHKALMETLFRAQLMKVVFATETLAAGINMPARTTVISSMAKRGNGNTINAIETSNMLQMAGRAGRRGMDTDGTCVIVATPFEGPDDAATILTNPVKPIQSQFSPSYALAVNLIARGEGKLDVARQLVQKSFAMWERRQVEEKVSGAIETHGEGVSEVVEATTQQNFMECLYQALQTELPRSAASPRIQKKIEVILNILGDPTLLKKASRSHVGLAKSLEMERSGLTFVEEELEGVKELVAGEEEDPILDYLFDNFDSMETQLEEKRRKVKKCEEELSQSPMTAMAELGNIALKAKSTPEGERLAAALQRARRDALSLDVPLTADELTGYAKSVIVADRKRRKLSTASPDLDAGTLINQLNSLDVGDDSWKDLVAMMDVLTSYGCLVVDQHLSGDSDKEGTRQYHITAAGENVGMLGFENSLWCLVAMGGTWDVMNSSSDLDEFREAMHALEDDDTADDEKDEAGPAIPAPQEEATKLVSLLCSLESCEIAGYVSCLVSEGSRGGSESTSIIDAFHKCTESQQRVIQTSMLCLERLLEVQKKAKVDEAMSKCPFELSYCEVVTQWAAGCTWSEALEMSEMAPGDLARILSRALDALRQLGNLPYVPVRKSEVDGTTVKKTSPGIHSEIRRLCREAARSMDRYPVKDPLPFEDVEIESVVEYDETDEIVVQVNEEDEVKS